MKTFLYYLTVAFVVFMLAYGAHMMGKRDEATAKYWEQRQSECRSLGNDWDLNNQGKCVEIEMY